VTVSSTEEWWWIAWVWGKTDL